MGEARTADGHVLTPQRGRIGDDRGALTLAPSIAMALDRQLSGGPGGMRVALSFQDRQGDFCRGSSARHVAGMACRDNDGRQLRYGAPGTARHSDQCSAGGDAEAMRSVRTIIAGDVPDCAGEKATRAKHWTNENRMTSI